ncbi:TPA: hypothetical protein N0F65_001852, partial [Lagenidium giganteum]
MDYLDISSVDSDIDTSLLTKRLFELGCQPIFSTFRDVSAAFGITTSMWRVYFRSKRCPDALLPRPTKTQHQHRVQVVPTSVTVPKEVKTSTEASHFVEKHHTDLVKSKDPTPPTKQDQCTRADAAMKSAEKIVDSCADPDQFVKLAVDNPMAANTAVMTEMAKSSTKVTELATLHFANSVFGATSPTKDVTFRVKWSTNMKTRLPKTRAEVVAAIEELYTLELEDLTRLTLALAFFELFLMCTAPLLFHNDRWIQRLTGQPEAWIPGHHTRFLHPNKLLALLRSDFRAVCHAQMIMVHWDGALFDDLEALRMRPG